MNGDLTDEFLPPASSPVRAARRRSQRVRQWSIAAGAIAGVTLLIAVLVLATGDDTPPRAARVVPRTKTTVSTRVRRTTTSTRGDSSTTTSSGAGAEVGPGPGSTTDDGPSVPPATDPVADPSGNITVTEDPGACAWDENAEELTDSGTVANSGAAEATVEVEVTWSDATGELDSWSDIETVPAGASTTWSVSSAWVDAPQGLTCQTALI